MPYNFDAAIKGGTTPQQITNYLTAQGRQKEAEEYFGKIQQPQSFLQKAGSDISESLKGSVDYAKSGFQQAASGGGNPLNLISGTGKVATGVVGAVGSLLAPVVKPIGQGLQKYADAVAGPVTEGISDPVQSFAQSKAGQATARVAEDVANYATFAGAVGGGMKPASAIKTGASDALKATTNATGKVLKNTGERAYGITIAPEERTAQAMLSNKAGLGPKPITEANTAARQGLVGTEFKLGVQAKKIQSDLWKNNIQPKLAAVKEKVDMKGFLGEVEKTIKKTADPTRRNDLIEALNKVKEDYKPVSKVKLEKLQDYKAGWAEFVPESSYKGKPIGSSLKAVHDVMADKARQIIKKAVGKEGSLAYDDYSNLYSIINSGVKSITGDPVAKSLSRNVWQLLMNKGITPAVTGAGKVLYKTGEALSKKAP